MIRLRDDQWLRFFPVLCILAGVCALAHAAGEPRRAVRIESNFDSGWKFMLGDVKNAEQPSFDDTQWRSLDLPHDWSIEGGFDPEAESGPRGGYVKLGIGWYRKTFRLRDDHRHKKVSIRFDGIYKNSDVWINGRHLGNRWGGYVSFHYDLTPHLRWDRPNVIAVRVDNSRQTCRWYSGSGIYRHVWLTIVDKLHVGHWGVCVSTPSVSDDSATVKIETLVRNEHDKLETCALTTAIFAPDGERVATAHTTEPVAPGAEFEFVQNLEVSRPIRWSPDTPALYRAKTTLESAGALVDDDVTPFGIRTVQWDGDHGLSINGRRTLMKGVSIHHDLGSLGAAFHDRALERRLEVLNSMGCNAIRTSHNPPAPQMLDICDRMGFLVIDEAFDKWAGSRYPTFSKDWRRDLRAMIRRDRNHPCVVLWSVGNEVRQQDDPEGPPMLKMLTDFTHALDPTRKVTCGASPNYYPSFVKMTDIAGLNYQEQWFDKYRRDIPDTPIVSTESFIYFRGKGDSHKAFQPLNPWLDVLGRDFVAGSFIWTGIDYLGEAETGWPAHGWNCSPIDTCGFRRPISYFTQSFWSDEPMVHLVVMDDALDTPRPVKPHWGWPKMASHWTLPALAGKNLKVAAFTNCPTVELFLNGRSLGARNLADFGNNTIFWEGVPYEPGSIEAVGGDGNRALCSHELRTAGEPAEIFLSADRRTILADGRDVCHVEISVVDSAGIRVPDAAHPIGFEVSGQGRIIGVDNGDLSSLESYQGTRRRAFHGRALVILRSTTRPGRIRLKATSPGLSSGAVAIDTRRAD